ncbi:MAG: hypothetical protein ACYTFW_05160 [Planctomycetota bacterium]|jgi:hypothetical protein
MNYLYIVFWGLLALLMAGLLATIAGYIKSVLAEAARSNDE